MQDETFIYILIDPRNNQIRYVGKSDKPEYRFKEHLFKSRLTSKTLKNNWIKSLLEKKLIPEMWIIEKCSQEIWEERERYWIKYYRDLGYDLTNGTNGGFEGGNRNFTLTTIEKLRQTHLGKTVSFETRQKISLSKKGRKYPNRVYSDEYRKSISERQRGEKNWNFGKSPSDETKLLMSLEQMGNVHRDSSSKYIGVSWHKNIKRWRSRSKGNYIGVFKTEIEAAKAYDFHVLSHNIPSKLNFGCDI